MCFINLFMVILETRLTLSTAKLNIKWLLSDDRRRNQIPLTQWSSIFLLRRTRPKTRIQNEFVDARFTMETDGENSFHATNIFDVFENFSS